MSVTYSEKAGRYIDTDYEAELDDNYDKNTCSICGKFIGKHGINRKETHTSCKKNIKK